MQRQTTNGKTEINVADTIYKTVFQIEYEVGGVLKNPNIALRSL